MRQLSTLLTLPSPAYVLEEEKLNANLALLDSVQQRSGAKILLALKGYAFWRVFENLKCTLSGSTASGLYEARLGYEEIEVQIRAKKCVCFLLRIKKKNLKAF